jgi:NAD(P)-dependent dehydrogenase (short-subunit alcohol dehydrogenase family)
MAVTYSNEFRCFKRQRCEKCAESNHRNVWAPGLRVQQCGNRRQTRHDVSIAGLVGFQGIPAYTASKHGVIGLTRTAALEYAKSKIRVNAVCPGVIQTPMIDRFTHGEAQIRKQLLEGEPIGRVGQPEEIAEAVLWLCSSAASFVTGQALAVDGGWVAQ